MIVHAMPQRTLEWFAVRRGKITGTSFPTMANGKKASIETLCLKTAAERVTGVSCENEYSNAAMENGVEMEAMGREAYEARDFVQVREVGFVELDEYIGVSPDGLVGDEGGVEIKCPQPHTHLSYLLARGKAWTGYKWQVQGTLWVTGRSWWDFISFCPAFPLGKRLLVERVTPDAECFRKLEAGAAFCRKRIAEIVNGFGNGNI